MQLVYRCLSQSIGVALPFGNRQQPSRMEDRLNGLEASAWFGNFPQNRHQEHDIKDLGRERQRIGACLYPPGIRDGGVVEFSVGFCPTSHTEIVFGRSVVSN